MSCSSDILNQDFSHKNSHRESYTAPIVFKREDKFIGNNGVTEACSNTVPVEHDVCDSQNKALVIDALFEKENLSGSTYSDNRSFAFHPDNTFDKDSDSYCFHKRADAAFPSYKLENIPNVPVKKLLLEIGRDLNKSDDEMTPFIELLVCRQWIENISHMKLMTESDWKSLELPYQLLKAIQQKLEEPYVGQISNDSTQCSESENPPFDQQQSPHEPSTQENSSNPPCVLVPETNLVEFVTSICDAHNIPSYQKDEALDCLCKQQWFNSTDDIKTLTKRQWECLNLPFSVYNVLQNTLADTSEASFNNTHLRKIVFTAGLALNRSPSDLVHVCEVLAPYDLRKQYNACSAQVTMEDITFCSLCTLDSIESFSKEDWLKLKLPLRLFEEILVQIQLWKQKPINEETKVFTKDSQSVKDTITKEPHYQNFHPSYIVTSLKDFERKRATVEDMLIQAGKLVGKTEEEIGFVIQKVVKDNWITSLHSLSNMQYSDWLNVGIPKRLADALATVLCNPSLLKLTLVQFSDNGANLYLQDIFSSVWQMEAEIPVPELRDATRGFVKLTENVLCNPFVESKRIIRKSNVYFKNLITKYKSVRSFVHSLGYEELGSIFALFLVSIPRLTQAHAILTKLASILQNRSKS